MAIDKQLLDRFLKDPTTVPKTNQEARIELLKETVQRHENKIAQIKVEESDLTGGIPVLENSIARENKPSTLIEAKNITQSGIQKNPSPFFIFTSLIILIVIAYIYYTQIQKGKEKEEARKMEAEKKRVEEENLPETKNITADDILNSGTAANAKKVLILLATIFIMVLIVYGFTLLFKQVKSMESAVMS